VEGITALEKIFSVETFDAVFIGAYNLSVSICLSEKLEPQEVEKKIKKIVLKAKHYGKKLGSFCQAGDMELNWRQALVY
jgi:2-keto-3-deoxy-L-rhamnonate aldolase RhmA